MRSSNLNHSLVMHHKRGVQYLNMASAYDVTEKDLIPAEVNETRISSPKNDVSMFPLDLELDGTATATATSEEVEQHHPHKLFGIVSFHGIILVTSFLALSAGTLGIRSGLTKSFKLHWIIQAIGSTGIVIGCLMGIKLSYDASLQPTP
jgi:hypothetical protein